MKKFVAIWPEPGEQFARQPDQPLPRWPDGRLQQLNNEERKLNWLHLHGYHDDTPIVGCFSCEWVSKL